MIVMSLDVEATGVDRFHGAAPYIVTTCDDENIQHMWQWDVDPLTRQPQIPPSDLREVQDAIDAADVIALQNGKFDKAILNVVGITLPWEKVRDTFTAGHLLASNHKHNLTDMCVEYLEHNIEPLELAVKQATQEARTVAKRDYPTWRLARAGDPMMPSIDPQSKRDDDKPSKADMWLCRALVKQSVADMLGCTTDQFALADIDHDTMVAACEASGYPTSWITVAGEYALGDTEVTLPLWNYMEAEIKRRGYWEHYLSQLRLPEIAHDMEQRGVTMLVDSTESMVDEYSLYVAEAEAKLVCAAEDYGWKLELADGASINDNMRQFFYGSVVQSCPRCTYKKVIKHWNGETCALPQSEGGTGDVCPKCAERKRNPSQQVLIVDENPCLQLPVINSKKTGNASLDAAAMQEYQTTLDDERAVDFLRTLSNKRSRDSQITYLEAYKRFWLSTRHKSHNVIRFSLNPHGTDHLRWASYNPNGQNISKKEEECSECDGVGCLDCHGTGMAMKSLRSCFGPAPGREWWSMDFKNIELRIPAYESGEEKMIEIFERPDEPPYWGSVHNLNCSLVYPDLYWPLAEVRDGFKKRYKSDYYQFGKNGGFCKQYGGGRRKTDATFRRSGAYDAINSGLPEVTRLNAHYIRQAERMGYVETLPDKSVDPQRGYPILASRTDDGRVLSTTPFNYHVSGSACWIKNRALVRCHKRIKQWNAEGWDGFIALEIHDEILFDMPAGSGAEPWRTNYGKAMELRALMEQGGSDVGIPTPVSVEYHATDWASGLAV